MILISVILFVGLVGAAFLGRRVRRCLPQDHLSADSKDAVKLAMGLVATMTALVLGLLVSSAKGTYDTARSEVRLEASFEPPSPIRRGEFGRQTQGGPLSWPRTHKRVTRFISLSSDSRRTMTHNARLRGKSRT